MHSGHRKKKRGNKLTRFLFTAPQSFIPRPATGSVIITAVSIQSAPSWITEVVNIDFLGPVFQSPTFVVLVANVCIGGATEWRRSKPLTLATFIGTFR